MSETPEIKLTDKQREFVKVYLANGFNGVRAAEKAGYKGDYCTLGVVANENLKKPKIRAFIDAEFRARSMGSDEVLIRLAQHGRGTVADILTDDGEFDLETAKERGAVGLIKKLKIKKTRYIPRDPDADIEETITHELELYDAQSALEKIGRAQKLFVDRQEVHTEQGPLIYIPDNGRNAADNTQSD